MRGVRGRSRRWGVLAALSLALHAVVLAWLAWPTAPTLVAAGPDLSLMSVELTRPEVKTAPAKASRPARAAPPSASAPIATSVSTPVEAASNGTAASVTAVGAVSGPAVASDALRAALRAGAGCARGASQSREDRERCEEKLGRLQANAPSYPAPMDPGKRAYYDAVVAAGPSGRGYGDPKPGGAQPDGDYFRVLNCSIKFGLGAKPKDRQGEVRLGKTPCAIPMQGSFFTPEASVRKR
ncbi:hypothetical protein [Caulobacter segnis]|uniref:hypothetical protein n=1 Tax=Caulobacter segnis TaxID=88688 RepID=UPI00285CAD3D|nr:hypothetical protein [Caulobacter segnis]MDR6624696.1 hypothetical protein [Caulobacter segnis]